MRWAVVLLIVLGVTAALAAAFFVALLQARTGPTAAAPDEQTIVIAAADLPAQTVLTADSLTTKKLPRRDVSAQVIADPSLAIGRVLVKDLKQGQNVATDDLVPKGSARELMSRLPEGKRAVTILVSEFTGSDIMLTPGCLVDVYASFRSMGGDAAPTPTCITLLEAIRVLALDGQVADPGKDPASRKDESFAASSHGRKVTLEVDPRQAKALQLAQEMGTLSLGLRGPKDTAVTDAKPVTLMSIASGLDELRHVLTTPPPAPEPATRSATPTVATAPTPAVIPTPPPTPTATAPKSRTMEVLVVRGDKVEKVTYQLPEPERP